MRPNFSASPAAKAWVSSVFAVPGTPSSRMWPPTSRLVSIKSIVSSCPTTALRTSLRMPSVIARISCRSIKDLPLPLVNVARDRNQRRDAATPAFGDGLGFAIERHAVDTGVASPAHALQPIQERALGKAAWRVQLARDVAQRRLNVAPDHALVVARETQELRGI